MFRKIFLKYSFAILALLSAGLFITSCSEEADSVVDIETTENFVNQSIYSLQTEGNVGKLGCFEFVFPVSILYPDGTTESVDDYETLRATIKAWFEANAASLDLPEKDSTRRRGFGYLADIPWDMLPTLDFPVDILTDSAEIVTVEDREQLFELKKTCKKDFYGNRGRHGHGKGDKCFSLVYPVTLVLPDGSTITGEDRKEIKTQLREWKAENPDNEERPSLQFPVTVELEDDSTQEIATQEDLEALKETCSAD